ncbi:DNA starvation/stationary phase protection protein DpsA [Haloarcula nitratireducens]|uniref:DNA starvation/stationary phase protection protein n=1 Tax=Haloarcula nitratireducens TaxID=2487749 RepID=A0AAW4PE20_9EURY|nr:DNA starvation/stationary phase protection protein DpsA [Halomicroarcula nitratireducens]MBX0295900.1 DNA starvation/stationary phase protection protein [Halomicroarcula nitratireducens]
MTREQLGLVREPEHGDRRQEWGTLDENELRIDRDDAEAVADALSVDFAGSFNLFYLLRKHFWTAEGAEFHEVAEFLEDAYKRTRAINDDLAIRIVELGGIPPNTPPTIQERAAVHLEAEGLYDLRASLAGDLDGYATLVASVREHVDLAEGVGDSGTAERLRDHLTTLEDDAHEIEQFLEDDTLVREEALD